MKPKSMKSAERCRVWGLTGGIASGKSQAARIFAEEGVPVIDADRIARELGSPGGTAYDEIVRRFGTGDRARLREIVFGDADARRDLESILHPRIVAESERRAAEHARQGARHVLYEAALLVETGRYRELDGLLVIDAPAELRRARLIARDGVAPELADLILGAQATDAQRLAAATHVIPNAGTLEELRAAIRAWITQAGWR
jgi:dephospho-CoA kinase